MPCCLALSETFVTKTNTKYITERIWQKVYKIVHVNRQKRPIFLSFLFHF